ncbi:hypothetical protein MXB_3776 [Myxobolus squamalis]|nr:hypothetical protein MXB_3776 [Myxobolus squamalis]
MDTEYYKCVRYYVECVTTRKFIEIDELLKLINNCPQLYVQAYTTKIYNLNYAKNLPEAILEHKSFTTLSIGICYFLAKSNWMHADVLIKPLISMLNSKIFPHQFVGSPQIVVAKETMTVNRMIWTNFSTITATLCSYASTLATSDPDFELIMKTVVYFWARLAKFSVKIFNASYINADSSSNTTEAKITNFQPASSFLMWYIMALSYTSIGIFLSLNSDDLSEFILNPENYHNFLRRANPLLFDIPDLVIKGVGILSFLNQHVVFLFFALVGCDIFSQGF